MGMIKKVKNDTGNDITYKGKTITPGSYYELQSKEEELEWAQDPGVQAAITAGTIVMNDGTQDITDPAAGLDYVKSLDASYIRSVKVSTTAPVTGQFLKATSATAIEWSGLSLTSSAATATGTTTTTSATDVQINSMTLTPGAGTYLVMFSSSWSHSAATTTYVSLYGNGARVDASERQLNVTDLKQYGMVVPVATQAVITVAAAQVIEAKWKTTGATATMYARSLTLVKIG